MGVFGRATAITIGILIGGGIGFYWRETHLLKVNIEKRIKLEEQLKELTKSRTEKEKLMLNQKYK